MESPQQDRNIPHQFSLFEYRSTGFFKPADRFEQPHPLHPLTDQIALQEDPETTLLQVGLRKGSWDFSPLQTVGYHPNPPGARGPEEVFERVAHTPIVISLDEEAPAWARDEAARCPPRIIFEQLDPWLGKETTRIFKKGLHTLIPRCPPGKSCEPSDADRTEILIFTDATTEEVLPHAKTVTEPPPVHKGDKRSDIRRQGRGPCEVGLEESKAVRPAGFDTACMESGEIAPSNGLARALRNLHLLKIDDEKFCRARPQPYQKVSEVKISLGNPCVVHPAKKPGGLSNHFPSTGPTDRIFVKEDGIERERAVQGFRHQKPFMTETTPPLTESDRSWCRQSSVSYLLEDSSIPGPQASCVQAPSKPP